CEALSAVGMRSSSPFGGRAGGGGWFQSGESSGQKESNTGPANGRREIEDRLIRHKAALLTDASMSGDQARVQELLSENADPNMSDEQGRLPLHAATFAGATAVLSSLLDARADANLREQGDGNRSLQIAAWQGHLEATELLLDNRADVEAVDERGWSPLCSAASQGHASVVRLLVQKGADPRRDVAVAGQGTMNALQAAAKGRHVEVAQVLKEALANAPAQSAAADGPSGLLLRAATGLKQQLAVVPRSPFSPRPVVGTFRAQRHVSSSPLSQVSACLGRVADVLAPCCSACRRAENK
ncbi:unnamed protein product, partial [Polarella glacialis]